jgi:hypothetical protein
VIISLCNNVSSLKLSVISAWQSSQLGRFVAGLKFPREYASMPAAQTPLYGADYDARSCFHDPSRVE